jgi:phenylacetate-CoA ligase
MPIDFRARDYLAPCTLLSLARTMSRLEWADPDELRAYQLRRLRSVLRYAAAHSPYWQTLFRREELDPSQLSSTTEIARLPLLSKETVRTRGAELVDRSARADASSWVSTSGSSGRPVRVLRDRRSRALEFAYYRRAWGWAGYTLGDSFAELGGHHFLRGDRDPERLVHWQPALRRLMINSLRVSPERMPEVCSALQRYKPRFLKGMPSALEHFVRCSEAARRAPTPLRAVFSGGEVVTPTARARIEAAYGCRLFDSYGHMEQTVAISQCSEGRYHVHGDYGLLELGEVERASDGGRQARVVGTGLHNRTMPLVRYDVGDRIELADVDERCACGRTLPIVRGIHGRLADVIQTPDGRALTALTTVLDVLGSLEAFQLVQLAPDRVRARVVPSHGWSPMRAHALQAALTRALGSSMTAEIDLVAHADLVREPGGKFRPVIGIRA